MFKILYRIRQGGEKKIFVQAEMEPFVEQVAQRWLDRYDRDEESFYADTLFL